MDPLARGGTTNNPLSLDINPLDAIIPICMKMRCPPIAPGPGRTITYSIDPTSEFVSD